MIELTLLSVLMIFLAYQVSRTQDLLKSVIFLAALSLVLSITFFIMQAPDVAIAEAGIGACITTAIYVLAIKRTGRWENEQN